MSDLTRAVKYLTENIRTSTNALKWVQEIPLDTPIRFTYRTKNDGALRHVEAVGRAIKRNNSCFRFQWIAINAKGYLAKPWITEGRNVSPRWWQDNALPYHLIESWQLLEPREAPLLVGWHYKSDYFGELFQ
jgi:hypothetical protein